MGLAVLGVDSRWDDTVTLALPVGHLSLVVDHHVASLSSGVLAHDSLGRYDLADERLLGFEKLKRDVRLVPVGVGLEEVLRL